MKALLVSLLLGIAGVGVAYRLYPAAESLARYPARISRDEAISRARAVASSYGQNVDEWVPWVQVERNLRTYEFLRTAPDHPLARVPQPYMIRVVFTQGPLRVDVDMDGNGMPTEFSFRDGRRPEFTGQPLTAEQEQQVLIDFAGRENSRFYKKVSSVNRGARGHVTTFEWRDDDQPEVIEHLEVTSSPDGIRRVVLHSQFSEAFLQRWVASFGRSSFRFVAIPILMVVGIAITNAIFFAGLARGHVKLRQTIRMFAGLLTIAVVGFTGGSEMQRVVIHANTINQPPAERLLQTLGWGVALAALFSAMWAVGRALMRPVGLGRWHTWDALLDGVVWRRQVGRSIACGLLLGAALTAIPVAACAAKWFARSDAQMAAPGWLAAVVPVSLPLTFLMPCWDLSGIFFLLVPLAATSYGRGWVPAWVRWPAVAVLAVMLVSMVRNVLIDGAGNYVLGGLLAAGFFAIYWGVDLLGVMMAELGYQAAGIALYFLHQESGTIHANGLAIAAAYGAIALAGAAAVVWARELEVAPEEKVVEIAAEREILQSEFAMAREAQERLLPAIPECVEGFSLAASCHPARDVGGDLYDFFRYPDGTYGMCVADVSGKGVPAALYMTMTKGILAAASRDAADLPGLAAILNAQLYAAGRKKTFVTMALGRLDVISRQLEYLRAGHNSILWRRSVDGVCQYRKPRGVGLGLAASRTFDRSIEMETLALETGDVVVFYSDGITEAMNASRELFGEDRLEAVVDRYARLEATGIESAILREVRGFMGDEPPHDDMTLLVIRA